MTMQYRINVIKMQLVGNMGSLKAFADIVILGFVLIKSCTVTEPGNGKIIIRLPQKQGRDGIWKPIVIPLQADFDQQVYDAILKAYTAARDASNCN